MIKNNSSNIFIFLVFCISISCNLSQPDQAAEPIFKDVFIAGEEGVIGYDDKQYAQFREQNITVTNSGRIVVVVQGRNTSSWSDRSGQDLLVKTSDDNGFTWSPAKKIISEDEKSICPNASIYDLETNRIFTLYSVFQWPFTEPELRKNWTGLKNRQYIVYSDDEGNSWSRPKEITNIAKADSVVQVFGSGEGIQLNHGNHSGRLVIPGGDMIRPNKRVFAWLSDDHGETWMSSEPVPNPQNRLTPCENAIVELRDGTLLMNERNSGIGQRWKSYSRDGGLTWSPFESIPDLPSISCNASIIRIEYKNKDILIYAGPVGPDPSITSFEGIDIKHEAKRQNGVVFVSFDNGESWPHRKLLVKDRFAYSSLMKLPDGQIGLFYEANSHKDIKLVKFTVEWLLKNYVPT